MISREGNISARHGREGGWTREVLAVNSRWRRRRRNNVEIINDGTQIKSNWVGASLPSLHRIPQDNNAAQEEEEKEKEKRLRPGATHIARV